VKAFENAAYRLGLAEGFLSEAEQDLGLERWRSCVDNAQLAVENTGKVVLALFGVASKTHDPAQPLAVLLRDRGLPSAVEDLIRQMLPDLLGMGSAEHFLTDYGDETTYTLPWSLFTRESAEDALTTARRSVRLAKQIQDLVRTGLQSEQNSP
jgi:HEPN domain-containing protein